MPDIALILAGSALGGMARFWVADRVAARLGERFPWGILLVNVSGALALGLLAGALPGGLDSGSGDPAWHMAGLGFLGSYTTVSSFSLQTLALFHRGAWRRAAANVGLSLGLCLAAAAAGLAVGTTVAGWWP
jgi:fluoride exporter